MDVRVFKLYLYDLKVGKKDGVKKDFQDQGVRDKQRQTLVKVYRFQSVTCYCSREENPE